MTSRRTVRVEIGGIIRTSNQSDVPRNACLLFLCNFTQLTMANQEKEDKTTKMDVDPKNEKSVDDKKKDKKEEEEELVTSPDLPCVIDGFYFQY